MQDCDEGYPLTVRIIEAVAKATDSDALDIDPLGETIDADALNNVFATVTEDAEASFSFRYSGCEVIVEDGEVDVRELPQPDGRNLPPNLTASD